MLAWQVTKKKMLLQCYALEAFYIVSSMVMSIAKNNNLLVITNFFGVKTICIIDIS